MNANLITFLRVFVLLVLATGAPEHRKAPVANIPPATSREPREYCKAVNLDHQEHSLIEIHVPASINHTQTSCSRVFVFEITPDVVGHNIMIEILLFGRVPDREKFLPFLAARKNDRPHIYIEGIATYKVIADGFDEIAYNFTLNYHHYVVKKHSFALGDKIYFAFYQRDAGPYNEPLHYNVNVSKHTDVPCPKQCSNQGSCNTHTGFCTCLAGFYLPDCSIKLNEHEIEVEYNLPISSNGWYYFYHDCSQDLETEVDIKVRELNENRMAIILRYQSENIRLPSERFFHYIYRLKKDNPEGILGTSHLDLKKLGSNVVIGVKNQGKDTSLSMITEKKKRTPRYVVYLIVGGIISFVGGLLICGIYIGERQDRKGRYETIQAQDRADQIHQSIELSEDSGSVITRRNIEPSED